MGITKLIAFSIILLHAPLVCCRSSDIKHISVLAIIRGGRGKDDDSSSILERTLKFLPEEIVGISPLQIGVTLYDAKNPSEPKSLVRASTFIDLPFAASTGYNAFVDLPRQPSWSPFLQKVIFLDKKKMNSKWTMNMLGIKFGWTAKFTLRDKWRKIIAWESTSGTWNTGSVQFIPLHTTATNNNGNNNRAPQSRMYVEVKAEAPRAVAALFDKSSALQSFFENVLIKGALKGFRKVVQKEDC